MSNVFIEQDADGWKAIQNKQVIVRGDTQKSTGDKANVLRPNDAILAERVRTTDKGIPDKWRKLYR
jgi:hypothetical protein